MVVPYILGGASAVASAIGGTRLLAALGGVQLLSWIPGLGGSGPDGGSGLDTGLMIVGGAGLLLAVALVKDE